MHKLLAALFPLLAVWGCATDPGFRPPFALEGTARFTILSTRPLAAGTKLSFLSLNIKPNELLLLQRCGEGCQTAKVIGQWQKSDFDRDVQQSVVLSDPGDYYVWIKREVAVGELGPLSPEACTFEGRNGIVRFVSGTDVFIVVEPPRP